MFITMKCRGSDCILKFRFIDVDIQSILLLSSALIQKCQEHLNTVQRESEAYVRVITKYKA